MRKLVELYSIGYPEKSFLSTISNVISTSYFRVYREIKVSYAYGAEYNKIFLYEFKTPVRVIYYKDSIVYIMG